VSRPDGGPAGWRAIARKDVQDAGRSRTVWLVFALLVVSAVGFVVLDTRSGDPDYLAFVDGLAGIVGVGLPLLSILLGYRAIAHERIDGSIRLSLSFPHSRRELLVGKFLGRSVVLLVPTVVIVLLAGAVAVVRYEPAAAIRWYPWVLLLTAGYGLAFLAVAVGLSMSTTVDRRLTLGAFGVYLLAVSLWDTLVSATVLVLHRFRFEALAELPSWAYLAHLLQPSEAYYHLLRVGVDVDRANRYAEAGTPWFVEPPVAALVLLAWTATPLLVGFALFRRADL